MQLELAIISDRGGRKYNEDACGHWHSRPPSVLRAWPTAPAATAAATSRRSSRCRRSSRAFAAAAGQAARGDRPAARVTNRSIIQHRADDRARRTCTARSSPCSSTSTRSTARLGPLRRFAAVRLSRRPGRGAHARPQPGAVAGRRRHARRRRRCARHPQRSELLSALGVGDRRPAGQRLGAAAGQVAGRRRVPAVHRRPVGVRRATTQLEAHAGRGRQPAAPGCTTLEQNVLPRRLAQAAPRQLQRAAVWVSEPGP